MSKARYGHKRRLNYKQAARVRDGLARLNLPDGTVRPYRPMPKDFFDVYVQIGWDGIEDYFNTNWRVIRRWIEQCGPEELRAARAAYVEEQRAIRRKRRRRAA